MKKNHSYIIILIVLLLQYVISCKEVAPVDHSNAVLTLEPHTLSAATLNIDFNTPAASSFTFKVYSTNVEWEITGIPDWITVKPASGIGDAIVTVSVSENKLTSNRVGILSFKSTDDSWSFAHTLTISQYRARLYATPEKDRVEFDGSASSATIKVASNIDNWAINKNASLTWCTATKGDGCINLSVTPNTGKSSRSGQIEVSTTDGLEYVTILQRPANISSTTSSLEFPVSGGSNAIEISSEAPWVASTSCAWINVSPESGFAGNSTVNIQVMANNSLTTRSDYVYIVLSDERKIEIPVSQEAITFSVDKTTLNAPSSGQDFELSIQSNVSWKLIDSIPSWLSLSPKTGDGNNKITISVSANQSYNARNTSFKLAPSSLTNAAVDIAVNQNGITFDTDSTAFHFSDKAGSAYFNITSDGSWIVNSTDSWIILDKTSGSGNSKIKVSVTENSTDSVRSGFVIASVDGKQDRIAVIQQGKYLNISSKALDFTSTGGSTNISIITNYSWTANASNGWITLSATEGNGDCNLTITALDNPTAIARNGYVDINPKDFNPVRISVHQAARYLTVSVDTLQFFYKGGTSDPVVITTDGFAEITTEADWITINNESSTQFTITTKEYDGELRRTGVVNVNIVDLVSGTLSKDIIVVQNDINNGYGYVDLGLSVLWATCNVGANSPDGYGDYFAWGETEPYYETGYALSTSPVWKSGKLIGYEWSSYKYCNGSSYTQTKYNTDSSYGTVDNRTTLYLSDDAAHVNWGGRWRMPTMAELEELQTNCTWTWTTLNGVKGYLVTSNVAGYEDASIFLPAAGYRYDFYLSYVGSRGSYWSSWLDTDASYYARYLNLNPENVSWYYHYRYFGQSVRPVCPSPVNISDNKVASIYLGSSQFDMVIGDNPIQLIATPMDINGNIVMAQVEWLSSDNSIAKVTNSGLVYAVGVGTCTITAYIGDVWKTCTVSVVTDYENGYGYVDLGLSVNWATYNVGATSPDGYGDYYAWGETEPYYWSGYAQSSYPIWNEGKSSGYNWSSYKYGSNFNHLTKYCNESNYGYNGYTDNKIVLDPEDDAAYINWGDSWRMPTKEEQDELRFNCIWTWTILNGVNGYKVTSNVEGYEGASIFLPAAGYRKDNNLYGVSDYGNYLSSSHRVWQEVGDVPDFIHFNSDFKGDGQGTCDRYYGFSVRPVCQ